MFRRLHSRRHDHRGAVAVEFALILPILMLLIFGIVQYGMYFWARSSAITAAREGARRASVGDFATCSDFRTFVRGQLDGGEVSGSSATVTRTILGKGTGNLLTNTFQAGDTMRISVQFNAFNMGLLPLPAGGTISINTSSRVENVGSSSLEVCS